MLTLDEFNSLAKELLNMQKDYPDLDEYMEVILKYTDLSSEDEEYEEELDSQFFSKIEIE